MIPKKSIIEKMDMTKRCFMNKTKQTKTRKQTSISGKINGKKRKLKQYLNVNKAINKWRSRP